MIVEEDYGDPRGDSQVILRVVFDFYEKSNFYDKIGYGRWFLVMVSILFLWKKVAVNNLGGTVGPLPG